MPVDAERRFYDRGTRQRLTKHSEDVLDYYVDLTAWMEPDEVVSACRAWCAPDDLIISYLEYSDDALLVWLAAGGDCKRHTVTCQVTTSAGRQKLCEFVISTHGTAPELPYVSASSAGVVVGMRSVPDNINGIKPQAADRLSFPVTYTGRRSGAQLVAITNGTMETLTISNIAVSGEFTQVNDSTGVILPGASVTVHVRFTPAEEGTRTGILTCKIGTAKVQQIIALVGVGNELPIASIGGGSNGTSPGTDNQTAIINVTPASLTFPETQIPASAAVQIITISNSGTRTLSVTQINLPDGFSLTTAVPTDISAGKTVSVGIVFTPGEPGAVSGVAKIISNADSGSGELRLSGSGKAAALKRLSISGREFVDSDGTGVRIRAINWFGAAGTRYVPYGLNERPWKAYIDQIKAWGFNTIRYPFSGTLTTDPYIPASAISSIQNPDLVGLTALEALDLFVAYANEQGVYFILDHHLRKAGPGSTDGTPVSSDYTLEDWIASWKTMAARYSNAKNVIGADLHNEPYSLAWDTWAGYCEKAGNAILAVAPEWVMFVQGVASYKNVYTWNGGALMGVADRPVSLSVADRVAYSPHDYGQSIAATQAWLAYEGRSTPVSWPENLYSYFSRSWGFIYEQGIAPLFVGEFGGFFGVDGKGQQTKANATYEKQWLQALLTYMSGDFDGNGASDIPAGTTGISAAYWSLNPNSGDTGGLLQDDWITPQIVKIDLLSSFLES